MNSNLCKINEAMCASLVRYTPRGAEPVDAASALLFLLLHEQQSGGTVNVRARIIQHLQSVTAPGNEPPVDAYKHHSYPLLAAAIALAKQTPSVWDVLLKEDKDRLDALMRAFVYVTNFISNDANTYRTGVSLQGGVYKSWNPNYRMTLVAPMLFCASYFGGIDKINELLLNFDYDVETEIFKKHGFKNILQCWTTPDIECPDDEWKPGARELLTNGGSAFIRNKDGALVEAGRGVGVKAAYQYGGTDDAAQIAKLLLSHCYSGGTVTSRTDENADGIYDAYIMDGTTSPYEGQEGMMKEFNTVDAHGMRSHAGYCQKDFCIAMGIMAACRALGILDITAEYDLFGAICVGNNDLLYKLEHGYRSYAMGRGSNVREKDIYGYQLWKAYWFAHFAPESNEADDKTRIEALEKTAQALSEELAAAKIILGVE